MVGGLGKCGCEFGAHNRHHRHGLLQDTQVTIEDTYHMVCNGITAGLVMKNYVHDAHNKPKQTLADACKLFFL